jgi:hypothetical protein
MAVDWEHSGRMADVWIRQHRDRSRVGSASSRQKSCSILWPSNIWSKKVASISIIVLWLHSEVNSVKTFFIFKHAWVFPPVRLINVHFYLSQVCLYSILLVYNKIQKNYLKKFIYVFDNTYKRLIKKNLNNLDAKERLSWKRGT